MQWRNWGKWEDQWMRWHSLYEAAVRGWGMFLHVWVWTLSSANFNPCSFGQATWTSLNFSFLKYNGQKGTCLTHILEKRNEQCMESTRPSTSHIVAMQTITTIVTLILGSLKYLLFWMSTFFFYRKRVLTLITVIQ